MVRTIATSTSHFSCFSASNETLPSSPPFRPPKLPLFWTWQKVKVGPLSVSPIGFGTWTWAWGNQLLWGYDQARDSELQGTFNLATENRINLCDMTDSYGTGRLIGQSEKLLGKFIREFRRVYDLMSARVLLSHYSVGTPDVVAINWCVCKGTIPIPQVKLKQDEENLVVLGWRLSSDELLQLEYVALESPLRMTQNIFQTR